MIRDQSILNGSDNMKAAEEIKKVAEEIKNIASNDDVKNITVESKDDVKNATMGLKDDMKKIIPDDPMKNVDLGSKKE